MNDTDTLKHPRAGEHQNAASVPLAGLSRGSSGESLHTKSNISRQGSRMRALLGVRTTVHAAVLAILLLLSVCNLYFWISEGSAKSAYATPFPAAVHFDDDDARDRSAARFKDAAALEALVSDLRRALDASSARVRLGVQQVGKRPTPYCWLTSECQG